MSTADDEVPFWLGETVDHLYPQCPALARHGQPRRGRGGIDPDGTDVCGICLRWWQARHKEPTHLQKEACSG